MRDETEHPETTPATTRIHTPRHRIARRFFDRRAGALHRVHDTLATVPGGEVNARALHSFLRCGVVFGDDTLIDGVDCLPGGADVVIEGDAWRVDRFDGYAEKLDRARWADVSRETLARASTDALVSTVERLLDRARPIVVPISGGMDSRAIIAALLELGVPPREIFTYTFGERGTLDFDLGNAVAKAAGTTHRVFDLGDLTFSPARMFETARRTDGNTDIIQPSVLTHIEEAYPDDAVFWSGYPGDAWGGSFYLQNPSRRWPEARDRFVQARELYDFFDGSSGEAGPPERVHVATRGIYDRVVDPDEHVFYLNHVERYTAHHLFFHGSDYACPFMEDEVVVFWLSVPQHLRAGKHLFNEALCARFPKLFCDVPTKSYGYAADARTRRQLAFRAKQTARKALWRVSPGAVRHPNMSYIDFAHGLRSRADVRAVAREGLSLLRARGVVDMARVDALWRAHDRAESNHAATLTLLISLGYLLEAFDLSAPDPSSHGA